MTKQEVIERIKANPDKTLSDIELLRAGITSRDVMIDQLEKRLRLIEHFYKAKIEDLQAEVQTQNDKAMEFWKAIIAIRKLAHEVLFVTR